MYKAMKIAAGCNNILPTLIYTGFNVMPLPHINSGCCRCMVFDNSIFFMQEYLSALSVIVYMKILLVSI